MSQPRAQGSAALGLLAIALPRINAELLPTWTPDYLIIVADVGDDLRIGLLPRRQALVFVRDMEHKLTDAHKHQFLMASKPGHAPVLVRAMRPEAPGVARDEEVVMAFIPATARGPHGAQ